MTPLHSLSLLVSLFAALLAGCPPALCAPATRTAEVDARGVLRWTDDHSEVALFGVNYYVPFALDYRLLKARGLDHEQAIREDVTHFRRLGLTAIRLHCWDREISDRQGNLRDNVHLRLLDYLIAQCKERGIYAVMTPIAWWDSPEQGGFSDLYTMPQMTTDPEARRAQCRYLQQYLNHVNPYTGLAYKDDPAIIAVELINEPQYPPHTPDGRVTAYIDALVDAVRSTGCRKPVFYNCWGGRHTAAAAARLDGVTFGWYPTGLVAGHELTGNYLPRVSDYPSMRDPKLAHQAKIVYEFDAADVGRCYLYPAMARAFRSGGAQIATQFQYEPLCVAADNANWQTHFLNLVYTPNKALSFAIAAEVFRQTPRGKRFPPYPEGERFESFRVSYEENLSEWVTRTAFLYSNDTSTTPPAPASLTRVWGCGSSPLVDYEGTGAYFLDRTAPGRWVLHVYPDAVEIADPYTGGTNEKVRLFWRTWPLTIRLPDLGDDFSVLPADPNGQRQTAAHGLFSVAPGEYTLLRKGASSPPGRRVAPAFIAPPPGVQPPTVRFRVPDRWREHRPLPCVVIVAAADPSECLLHIHTPGRTGYRAIPLSRTGAYAYHATLPAQWLPPGDVHFFATVRTRTGSYRFPGGAPWEGAEPTPLPPVELLALPRNAKLPPVAFNGPPGAAGGVRLTAGPDNDPAHPAVCLEADRFGPPPSCVAVKVPVPKRAGDLSVYDSVTVTARGGGKTTMVEVGLVEDDGNAFGTAVPLTTDWNDVTVPFEKLRPLWSTGGRRLEPGRIRLVSLVTGAWILPGGRNGPHRVEIASVRLTRKPDRRTVHLAADDDPVLLIAPAAQHVKVHGEPGATALVWGKDRGRRALRVGVDGFGPEPSCSSLEVEVEPNLDLWRDKLRQATTLLVTARAGDPLTDKVELVLVEGDGAPWGTVMSLPQTWQTIHVPLSSLRYFAHWNPSCKDRGGPGDHVRLDQVRRVRLTFGAFLYGKRAARPHAFELQDIALGHTP